MHVGKGVLATSPPPPLSDSHAMKTWPCIHTYINRLIIRCMEAHSEQAMVTGLVPFLHASTAPDTYMRCLF